MSDLSIQFMTDQPNADLLVILLSSDLAFPPYLQQIDAVLGGGVVFNIQRQNFTGNRGEFLQVHY